jgi:hypothetical protein
MGDETARHAGKTRRDTSESTKDLPGRTLALLAAFGGLDIRREAGGYRIPVGSLLAAPPRLLARIVLCVLSLMFLGSVVTFPYFSPVTNVEEVTLFYTSAGNLVKYGYLNSGFLPDYSTSSRPVDHPYIYNHMPPGPDIFIAIMLQVTGGSYRFVRLVFWAMFLVGMVCYFRFGELILQRFEVSGAGYAILLISPSMILHTFDDPVYATFPLLGFLPLLTLQAFYRTGRGWYLASTLGVGLVSAVYLDYLTLLMVSWCWALLYFTQLLPLRLRHLVAFACVIVGGLVLHLVQNFLYLGQDLFFRELGMTISNRITGLPTKEELKVFYQAHGLVHHGASPLNVLGFLYHLWLGVTFPGRLPLVATAVVATVWVVGRSARWERDRQSVTITGSIEIPALGRFVALWGWVVGTILLPMIMLPAFTTEYGIHGTGLHWYFLGIGVTASVLYGVRAALAQMPRDLQSTLSHNLFNVLLALVVLGLLGNVLWRVGTYQLGQFHIAAAIYREATFNKLDQIRLRFSGKVFMTNINPVPVGFFAGEAGHGVCELASLPEAGGIDPSQCRVSYMREREHYRTVRPRYFFFFRQLFPGFSQCLPSEYYPMLQKGGDRCFEAMRERLAARFLRVTDTGLFEVYDLAGKP